MLVFKLAWRNLFRNVRRTILTCMMLATSLAILIFVDGLMLSVTKMMVGSITGTLAGEAQIHRDGFLENLDVELVLDNPEALLETAKSDAAVEKVAPRIMVGGMIASTYNTSGGLVYGVDAQAEMGLSKIREAVVSGEYLTGEDREILIGKPLAEIL